MEESRFRRGENDLYPWGVQCSLVTPVTQEQRTPRGGGAGGEHLRYSSVASSEALVSRSAEKRLKRSTSAARLSASATVTTAV